MKVSVPTKILGATAVTILFCLSATSNAMAQLVRQPNGTLHLSETAPPATLSATGIRQPGHANRPALVETTTDLINWNFRHVPGNSPSYPPTVSPRIFTTPMNVDNGRFFRLKLSSA